MCFKIYDFNFIYSYAHCLQMIKVSRTETHAPEAMEEPFVREQRVRDLLPERSLQQLGEFFLPNRVWRRHKHLGEDSVRGLLRSTVRLHTVQP